MFIYMGSCVRGSGGSVVEVNLNLSWIEYWWNYYNIN